MGIRVGTGYDVHRLVENRPLIVGGVTIPYKKGLAGHSDADVLTHAICDALLGALNKGNIGDHFPDTDPEYKDISSITLLENVMSLVKENGYSMDYVDSVLIAENPKFKPHILSIRNSLAVAMSVPSELVSVKATTTEGLGFEGKGEGIAAQAVVLLSQ